MVVSGVFHVFFNPDISIIQYYLLDRGLGLVHTLIGGKILVVSPIISLRNLSFVVLISVLILS